MVLEQLCSGEFLLLNFESVLEGGDELIDLLFELVAELVGALLDLVQPSL